MARNIGLSSTGTGYRAVLVLRPKSGEGEPYMIANGIYDTDGPAKGRISYWRHNHPERFIDGWIEEAEITWKIPASRRGSPVSGYLT